MLRSRLRLSDLVLALSLLPLTGPVPVSAQRGAFEGYLVDDSNLQPVPDAQITLVDGERRLATVTSDSVGAFLLPVPWGGQEFQVEARRIGYTTTLSQAVRVGVGDTLSVEFRILPDAVVLDPITVTARGNQGRFQFERRREEWGRGIFLDPDDIRAMNLTHVAEVLDDQEKIFFRWTWGGGIDGFGGRYPEIRTFLGRGCMTYSIDGRAIWEPPPGHPDADVNPWLRWPLRDLRAEDVVAVEIYRSTNESAPDVWKLGVSRNPDRIGACGVTVFWTRFGW